MEGLAALPSPGPQTTAAGTGVDSRSQQATGHPVTGASSVHRHRGLKAGPIPECLSCAGDASPGGRSARQGPGDGTRDSSVTSPGASKQQQTDGQHRDFCAQSLRGLFQQSPESCVPVGGEEIHT